MPHISQISRATDDKTAQPRGSGTRPVTGAGATGSQTRATPAGPARTARPARPARPSANPV